MKNLNKTRAVELTNGMTFGVLNSKTHGFEYFEYLDNKLLELKECIIKEGNLEWTTYIHTGSVFDCEYVNEITKL